MLLIGIIGFVGYWLISKQDRDSNNENINGNSTFIPWQYSETDGWRYTGSGYQLTCPDPILSISPVNTQEATEIMYPGQYRGSPYKAHGGFHLRRSNSDNISVYLPTDSYLTGMVKYRDSNSDPQIIVDFLHPCGISMRFDHLHTLPGELAVLMG